jgi:hypothetical protein
MTTTVLNPGPLATIPPQVEQGTTETIPWQINMTGALTNVSGGSVSDPTTTFTDVTRSPAVLVTLEDPPTVLDQVFVEQIIRGSVLTPGNNYELVVTFDAGGITVLSVVLKLICPL